MIGSTLQKKLQVLLLCFFLSMSAFFRILGIMRDACFQGNVNTD
jgi:hypothetical protein